MKLALALPALVLLASCGSSPGFLNTDVLEPSGMQKPQQQGVKLQGGTFQEGTLTYLGRGDVNAIYGSYIESMRKEGWSPSSSEGDPNKGLQGKLKKDTRMLSLSVMPVGGSTGDSSVQVTIKVTTDTR